MVASLVAVQQQQQTSSSSSLTAFVQGGTAARSDPSSSSSSRMLTSANPNTNISSSSNNASSATQPAAGRGRNITRHRKRSSRGQIAYDNLLNGGSEISTSSGRGLAPNASSQQQLQLAAPEKPCHSARLALLCAQNCAQMGARTQLALCPPGKNRRALQAALRQKNLERQQQLQNYRSNSNSNFSFAGLEKLIGAEQLEDYEVQEEDYLMHYQSDSDEEASSGDEDELLEMEEMFSEESIDLDDETRYKNCPEPLYAPAVVAAEQQQGSKFPFNRRKLRYFDSMSADEDVTTRAYCKKELQRCRQRAAQALCRRLKRQLTASSSENNINSGSSSSSRRRMDDDEESTGSNVLTPFEPTMTPAMAASLLQESLLVNPQESVEGIAACYDGIVAAGVALLEVPDPTQPSKARASRSEIMGALAPLLITTLEQPSGEVILLLARLRRLCGTVRYQRRFVQRIAPALIRPPGAAIWCLRHQNDMEAIFAATELILDAAFDVFAKGWYDRGRWMLADSKRAETLSAAAQQLRNLSQEPADGLAFLQHRRVGANHHRHTSSNNEAEPLAEWEVIAVDRQIRVSISNVLQTDWTKATEKVHEAFPRPTRQHRGSTTSRAGSNNNNNAALALASPRATPRSPLATRRGSSQSSDDAAARTVSPPPPPETPSSLSPDSQQQQQQQQQQQASSMPPPKSPKSPHRGLQPTGVVESSPAAAVGANAMSPQRTVAHLLTPSLTPLSPSASSVGSTGPVAAAVSTDMITYRPASASTTSTAASGAPTAHYRMLTSTAAERKRTVAACRALRAQISRFEDAFIQMHGRPPKGAADRAPLATTYAQYREWKRAIRADAACRIQALYRGASCRGKLSDLGNPALSRIIRKGAGRRDNLVAKIGLPINIGEPADTPPQDVFGGGGGGKPAALEKGQWAVARQPSNSSPPASPLPYPPSSTGSSSPTQSTDLSNMSFADLQARKRDLKQQLKQYDMNFARKHGRMPVKAEKEPIRHLYEAYNSLKSQISQMEREGRHLLPGAATATASQSNSSNPSMPQRTVSPPSEGSEDSAAGARISPNPVPRNKRKLPKPMSTSSSSSAAAASTASSSTVASVPVSTTGSSATNTSSAAAALESQDLAALKAEKSSLHTMLRSYERDFFRENNRQVSSFADIRPVASQYRRYKEIKRAIAARQQQQQQHGGNS